jgi:hypothetical protein
LKIDSQLRTFPWPQFEMGGTGNLPVPTGYQPGGTEAGAENLEAKNLSDAAVIPRGKLSRGTGRLPVLPKDALEKIRAVADAARKLRALRRQIMDANGWSLRDLYRTLETPGDNKLRDAHATLDTAVRAAYGMKEKEDILAFLLKLNLELADKESKGEPITPPGLPPFVVNRESFISEDCVRMPGTVYPPYEPPNPTPLKKPNSVQAEADAAHFYSVKEDSVPYPSGEDGNRKAE